MSAEQAALDFASELVHGEGVHQMSTLNPAKVRVLTALHQLDRPCTDRHLAQALSWTTQYVYRMVNELAEQGILTRTQGRANPLGGRPSTYYRCICATNQEGTDR